MYKLSQLTLENATEIGSHLRRLGKESDSLEMVASQCVRYLREHLLDAETGESACSLVRFFKTHRYGSLPEELQLKAREGLSKAEASMEEVKCLTLLGTVGEQTDWCDRTTSTGHQAIPLTSEKAVSRIPIIRCQPHGA